MHSHWGNFEISMHPVLWNFDVLRKPLIILLSLNPGTQANEKETNFVLWCSISFTDTEFQKWRFRRRWLAYENLIKKVSLPQNPDSLTDCHIFLGRGTVLEYHGILSGFLQTIRICQGVLCNLHRKKSLQVCSCLLWARYAYRCWFSLTIWFRNLFRDHGSRMIARGLKRHIYVGRQCTLPIKKFWSLRATWKIFFCLPRDDCECTQISETGSRIHIDTGSHVILFLSG